MCSFLAAALLELVLAQRGRYVDALEPKQRIEGPLRLVVLNAGFAKVNEHYRRHPPTETISHARLRDSGITNTRERQQRSVDRLLARLVRAAIRRRYH
jgi:hypothetical protein